ncbi:MAG: photosynthetic complex assembly protein PuhC, partial [Pseudomonadota bacterium]
TDRPLVGVPAEAPVISERSVVLEGDGRAIRVTDPTTGEIVMNLENGGFISVVNDGLERARLVARVDGNPPVTLTLFETGRMSLNDPASGWRTQLSSFGPGNTAVWLNVLNKK